MKMLAVWYGAAIALAGISSEFAASSGDPLGPIGVSTKPPVALEKPVTKALFGVKVIDRYRNLHFLAGGAGRLAT
jgi:hypothetical protein